MMDGFEYISYYIKLGGKSEMSISVRLLLNNMNFSAGSLALVA